MLVSAIVATAHNNVIGKDNQIPWYLPADLKYFKKTTLNHHIIMGRNCFESIGKPLPKRTNIILTRNPYYVASNCLVVNSLKEAIEIAFYNGEEEVFIIGGAQIYNQSLSMWDRLYLTEVDLEAEGDVFFPNINLNEWDLSSEEKHDADEKNKFPYTFKVFDRKKVTL